ncbi:hypothetical protein BCR37DRAFT_213689 [Protomyces lactucae-debilis]|uniref:Uncharacterized protein n=1 Tax=Protomyces lactucae-debilis TaxID=2754530 RepID=A0A1Y2FQN4_PROLT|nr:uncharacterized protein BCR37DRAFT_213689 [Protomyces lactucae-debilis]ORY86290.1 hypothetical protein BCR37DRAFT_213689 [Protomyces lactucae-debilis]
MPSDEFLGATGRQSFAHCRTCQSRIATNQQRARAARRGIGGAQSSQRQVLARPNSASKTCTLCKLEKPEREFVDVTGRRPFARCHTCRERLTRNRQRARATARVRANLPSHVPASVLECAGSVSRMGIDADYVPEVHSIGLRDRQCTHCGALHFEWEDTSNGTGIYLSCCHYGQVQPRRVKGPPAPLERLLHGGDTISKHFKNNITGYNNAMAFTSMVYTKDDRLPADGGGPIPFVVKGQLAHLHAALFKPANAKNAAFAQLYLYDPEGATAARFDYSQTNKNVKRFKSVKTHSSPRTKQRMRSLSSGFVNMKRNNFVSVSPHQI